MKTNIKLFAIFLAVLLFSACSIRLLPSYDREVADGIDKAARMTDRFYLEMLEKTINEAGGRAYPLFRDQYLNIEIELNALYNRNRVRPLNNNSARIAEIALQKWISYKETHKKQNMISDGIIRLNRKYMNDLFYTMQIAEKAKP